MGFPYVGPTAEYYHGDTLKDAGARELTSRAEYTRRASAAMLTPQSSYSILLALAILLGIVVRARFVLATDFPLNDGGLFLVMSRAIADAHYSLPSFVTYNSIRIPFGYSPLGFYVAAGLSAATGRSLTDVLRYLPLVVTSATVVAFAAFARAILTSRVAVVASVFAFALVPRSFIWLLMGGGLTRSFGLLFTILALHQAFLLYTRASTVHVLLFGAFAALTVLSHLGTAPFLLWSAVLMFLAYGRTARAVVGSAVAGVLAVALSAPWWATVVAAHGLAPFVAASASGSSLFSADRSVRFALLTNLAKLGVTTMDEAYFPLVGTLALAGSVASLTVAEFYLAAWWVATLVLDTRAGATYATIPASLLAGVAVAYVAMPLTRGRTVRRLTEAPVSSIVGRWTERARGALVRWMPPILLVALVGYAAIGALILDPDRSIAAAMLVTVSPAERGAMQWVSRSTPVASRYLVIAPRRWAVNDVAEWFPILANRTSVATVQGTEWLPNHAFSRAVAVDSAVEVCASGTTACLQSVRQTKGLSFTHVFIPKSPNAPCCAALRGSVREDPRYQVIYDGPGATIAVVHSE